ncbi:hypothetical protein ACFLRW_03200 [Acidobacteriota bacterium]
MNRRKNLILKKKFMLLIGISLSLVFLCSGFEAATVDSHSNQPLSFNSIMNPNSLVNIDGIAFMCGTSPKSTEDTKTSTAADIKTSKLKSGKKTVTDQKNSTSRRGAIIDD